MPRQRMTWEQVDRSIHRIRGLFPRDSRIVEFGISPLTKKISEIYDLQVVERGKVARRWDIDPNIIISTPVNESEKGAWFWFPDKERLPKQVELIILHDVEGDLYPDTFLTHEHLKNMATDFLLISNKNDKSENLVESMEKELNGEKKLLINEPDMSIWHIAKSIEKANNSQSTIRPDLITRLYYAAGFRKLVENRITKLLQKMPEDIRYRELAARIEAKPGSWESASHMYEEIHESKPNYRDVAWQTVRSSIYSARWNIVGRILSNHPELWGNDKIQNMIEKKFQLIGEDATNKAIELIISHRYNPNWLIEKWVNSEFNRNQDLDSPVAKIALDRFHGAHIGHEVMQRINLGEMEAANKIILSCTNNHGIIATLESICIDENLPVLVNDSIREILSDCDSETIHQAIQAIGRRGDPSQFLGKSSIMMMIENGTTLYSWMIEFGLRSGDKSLLNSLFERGLPGTTRAIIDALDNLVANRRDDRITILIEVISENHALFADQELRRSICKSLLVVADPIITHAFAMEAIRLEPQDAVCGVIALEASIATAEPEVILSTADIVLSMRSRSSQIDYASIAIAAIRMNKTGYAKDLLTRNRLKMDLRAQRIRVGLPFHEDDWEKTLFEVEQTPAKFRDDPTIKIYHAKALSSMMKHESAEEVANSINDLTERSILLYSLRQSWGDFEGALESWNHALLECDLSEMPLDWGDSGFDYFALSSPTPTISNDSKTLVSVIMTIHKWNDAFPLAVSSILHQSHSNLELIIVDDCSPKENLEMYDSLLQDERIVRIRMEENVGTYACRNKGLDIARGDFVTFADSDDWNHPQRIRKAILRMEELGLDLSLGRYVRINELGIVHFNGGRLSRFALMGMIIRRSVLVEHKFRFDGRARIAADSELFERLRIVLGADRTLRHSGIEIVALHHSDSLTGGGEQAIDWTGPSQKRLAYVAGYSNFHNKIMRNEFRETNNLEFQPPSDSILGEYPNDNQKRIRHALNVHQIKTNEVSHQLERDENESIYVFMATYPGGYNTVGDAIRSLLSQSVNLTKIILHVNGNSRPPKLPKDSRLKVILSDENLADNGKFQHMDKFNGYLFTVDDDIEYPHNYIEKLILEVERYERKAIVGVHGACLPFGPTLTRWSQYKELRRSHLFQQEQASRIQVDILGTGTTAFHSSINPPKAHNMNTIKMVDLHLATWAASQGIPMYLVPRRRNWLTEFENVGDDRIWSMTQEDRDLQNNMLSTIGLNSQWDRGAESWFTINNGPLSITKEWSHRELPPGLSLPPLQEWPELSDNPLVTIYVPAYNAEKYIEECINSALNQTYNRIEVCIHDDGSTDKTLKLLQRKFGDIGNVTISTATNQGIGGASNQAIRMGKGELILQLDSDDFIEPETIEILVDAIGRNHVCAYGRFRRITHNGEFIDDGWEEPIFSRARLLRSMIVHPPRLFRRDAWEFVGGHNEEITNAVDYDFYTRLSEVGTMAHVSNILYSYRMQDLSTSHTKNEIQTTNTHGVVRRSLERQGLNDYDLHIPNPKYPRRFSIIDRRFTVPTNDES